MSRSHKIKLLCSVSEYFFVVIEGQSPKVAVTKKMPRHIAAMSMSYAVPKL